MIRRVVARFKIAVIRKEHGEYCVRSPDNKDWNGGCYKSEGEAKKRLEQVEWFKENKAASRVASRFLLGMAEDIAPLLNGFRRAVEAMENKWTELDGKRDDSMTPVRAMVFLPGAFEVLQNIGKAHRIFWGLLQQYKITSTSDRKLIEQASKEFYKARIQKPKREVAMDALKKKADLYRSYLEAAERVIQKGELHADEVSDTAGCFTLVNAGGFTPEQMADVNKVVEKASSLLKAKGFGKVCYGTVQVTTNISNAKTLAFYSVQTDEMFVRGNLKGKQGPAVGTIIHELGHRLHVQFLKGQNNQIKSLYDALLKGETTATQEMLADKSHWPKPGDTHVQKNGDVFIVDRVDLNRNYDYTVIMHMQDEPMIKGTMPLQGWLGNNGIRKKETFITPYARTNPSENFAEMFEHYILDTLPDGQVQMLEAIIK